MRADPRARRTLTAIGMALLICGCSPAPSTQIEMAANDARSAPSEDGFDWTVIDAYRPQGAVAGPAEMDARLDALPEAFLHDADPRDEAARQLVLQVDAMSPLADPEAALSRIETLMRELDTRFGPDAALRASLLHHRIWALVELGRADEAQAAQVEAERIAAAATGPAARLVRAQVAGARAFILSKGDDMAAAADALRDAHLMLDAPAPFEAFEHANLLRGTATLDYFAGRQVQSVETGRAGVALLDAAVDPRRPNQIDRHVGAVSTLAALEGITGEAEPAFANQEKAVRLAAAYLPEDSHTVSTLLHNYADALSRRGRYRESEAVYRTALERTAARLGPDHPDVGLTLGKLGETQMRRGRYAAAERSLGQALQIVRGETRPMDVAFTAGHAGDAATQAGAFDAADAYYREAVALMQAGDEDGADAHPPVSGVTQLYYSDLLSRLGRHGEALAQAEAGAARLLPALPEGSTEGRLARATLAFARSQSDPAAAHASASDLRDELDLALRGSGFAEAGWSRASAALRRPLALLAQVAVRAGDAPESFRLLQLATLSDMGEWEQRRKVAAAGADPDGRNRLETLRRTRESLMRADTALQEAVAAGDRSEARRHRQEMSVLREGLSEALDGFPDMARGGLTLRSLAEVRAALPPDQAVLMVVADPRPTAILLRSDRTVLRYTELLGAELHKAAGGLRRAVMRGEASSPTDEAAALGWLFEAGDLDGVELLHVLGVDVYGRFPMHLLPDPSAPERWLGERVAINHLSGLDALFGEANAQTHSGRMPRLLALGDADFRGRSDVAPGMDEDADANAWNAALPASDPLAEALRRLPPLPGSRAEVEDIAGTFGGEATLLLGPDATETAFRAALPEMADLIVLATHGLAAGQLPGLSEPALVFAQDDQADAGPAQDGLLTAFEAADFVLSADLVILSACNTAAAEGGDPALSGLPRAFVSAGANSVMVSHWPVRDDAAAFLSTAVFAARQDGAQPAVALRDAMGALRASGLPDADDPSIWAPFVVVGG